MSQFTLYQMHAEKTVLYTEHGSHLYGLANEHSDKDSYEVFLSGHGRMKQYAKQHVDKDDNDVTVVHLNRFIASVLKGSPVALEALFSKQATVDNDYSAFFAALRPSPYRVITMYRKLAMNFAFEESKTEYKAFKTVRHAFRLALNLNDFMKCGRFNPELTQEQAEYITTMAEFRSTPEFRSLLEQAFEQASQGIWNCPESAI